MSSDQNNEAGRCDQPSLIKKVIIVGGGSAGWLAANHLAKRLGTNQENGLEVVLIESPNIPTIGVGEGTVPAMRNTLKYFGISETEFITECDATFKQGIKFVDWLNNPVAGKTDYYHHVFDYPNISDIDLTPYWLMEHALQGNSFVDALSVQGQVCDAGLAPKLITTPEFQGITSYAYHLDAGKFTQILTKNAVNRLGVKHIRADVNAVTQHENGDIKSLLTDQYGEIYADFFVDCSGFNGLLIDKALGIKFVDKSDVLFADRAVAIQVPYEDKTSDIPSFTVSTAQTNGWIWDIGLKQRRGIGHVYSSSHTDHDQAEKQLRDYIGPVADNINSRLLKMRIGYRDEFWHKNCVALGLAQGFVEPLEATGLLVFDATAKMLAERFPVGKSDMGLIATQFNQQVKKSWESVIDFVKLHYCLSKRTDSDFWIENRSAETIPDSLKERLARWRFQPPSAYDFASKHEVFNLDNYLYVLYGMKFHTEIKNIAGRLCEHAAAKQMFAQQQTYAQTLIENLPKHRVLIEKIHQFGLQKC